MRYGSVCSGIEAATQAWHPLGWQPAFFSEIEAFPSAVLAHHYGSNMPGEVLSSNGVPNLGDMTKFEEWPEYAIDLLVGGTPCQSFSVAGLRGGLDDARGNLMLTYAAIARRYRPRWLVWENVPGVLSSDGGRDFASLLGLLSGRRVQVPADGWRNAGIVEGYEGAYGLAWRVLDAQYVRVDGFPFAVPQRRRRVFVVGYIGDWRRAAAVLLELEGMRGDSAPRRQAGKRAAPTISARPTGGGGLGTDFDLDGGLITSTGNVAHCLNAGGMGRQDYETETMVAHTLLSKANSSHEATMETYVAHTLKGEGFDGSEDGSGRGTPIVPVPMTLAIRGRDGEPDIEWRQDGTSNAILTPNGGRAGVGVGAVAIPFDTTQITSAANYSNPRNGDPCHPLASGAHAPAIAIQAGATRENPNSGPDGAGIQQDIAYTIEARAEVQAVSYALRPDAGRSGEAKNPSPDSQGNMRMRDAGFNYCEEFSPTLDSTAAPTLAREWAVRRLTPTECERLQGFPDDFTNIPWRGKPIAPDGPRYKSLGNSMACNVMRWIGQRIEITEKILQSEDAA